MDLTTMSNTESILSQNQMLAEQINQEAKQNPCSPYAGKFVGIANGRVVVVAETLREAMQKLRQVEPDSSKCCCIEASYDYDQVHDIWVTAQ
jgi:hypothetical protein